MPKKVILIVDNHAEFLLTRAEFVAGAGYKVLTAADPEKARSLANTRKIDLAVVDLRLLNEEDPDDMTGLFLAKELHARVPVIIMSSFPTLAALRQALRRNELGESSADDFVTKMDGPAVLINSIGNLLDKPQTAARKKNSRSRLLRFAQVFLGIAFIGMVAVFIGMGLFDEKAAVFATLLFGGLQVVLAGVAIFFRN